jgi:DNA polymerase-3 subunit beta
MKIICIKTELNNAINIALKAVPGKTTMDILECMVIKASADKIQIIANDLELGIETSITGQVEEEGEICVKAKMFSEIIRKLPSDEIKIFTEENMLHIVCGKAKFSIPVQSTEEFPFLPEVMKEKKIIISQYTLRNMIQKTVFSISDNENNKIMTGELLEINGSKISLSSLDGHRISIKNENLKEEYDHIRVIVPGKTLIEVSKILTGNVDDPVNLFFTDKHILFEFENTIILSRLIEGKYYQIENMISKDYETKITINRREMLESIERTTLLLKESDKKPVLFDIKDSEMVFSLHSDFGNMDEEMDIEKEGKDILIGFNPRLMMDALRAIENETINIFFVNQKAPCFIRDENESYIYIIMPININAN